MVTCPAAGPFRARTWPTSWSRTSVILARCLLGFRDALYGCIGRLTEHMGFQPRIAERSARVEPLDQTDEVGHALVERSDRCRVRVEELAPVRACPEWDEHGLELDEHVLNRVLLGLPGEMDADGVVPVVHAHPYPICGHRAHLRHLQQGLDLTRERAHSLYGPHGVPARDQVLRL